MDPAVSLVRINDNLKVLRPLSSLIRIGIILVTLARLFYNVEGLVVSIIIAPTLVVHNPSYWSSTSLPRRLNSLDLLF